MRVMSAGDGYRYLLKTVAAGDGDRDLATSLTRYYAQKGTPPGFWLGSGVEALGDGQVAPGDAVSEDQLRLLVGMGRDPITGNPLGLAYPVFRGPEERIQDRIADLAESLTPDARAAAISEIEAEEAVRTSRRAVAGFDFTFSVPKSVSALWAVADGRTQSLIVEAHHAAVMDVIALMEREVAATRAGSNSTEGAVAQVEVTGLIATAYDHYDSRASDPQLHTHVVISNKVKTVHDGKWRSLDGRPLHSAVVALSEHYNGLLADYLARTLNLGWEGRDRGRDRNPIWEVIGVPEQLIQEFSSRSRDIDAVKDKLIAEFVQRHGRQPSSRTVIKLRAQATLQTRPEKVVKSLADLTAEWRIRATEVLGQDAPMWAAQLIGNSSRPPDLRADELPLAMLADIGRTVVIVVGEKRSTWRRWNLYAEASRQIMGARFASTEDREAVLGLIVDAAENASLRLTPPELAASPVAFQRLDGTSVFRPKHSVVFSSFQLLAAEDRLLVRSNTTAAPTVGIEVMDRVTRRPDAEDRLLGADQRAALAAVATSGRIVDVLVGPAGTGKTTAMNALRRAWEHEHGPGSVIGLAPSAAAAQVLADDLGIGSENTAKWLLDHDLGKATLREGALVIVDEASLAGTMTLDKITSHVAEAGAKVLLVGDWAQLDAVDAGGSFGMLVRDRNDAPGLIDVHRFRNDWEKDASLRLRIGDTDVIDTYIDQDRIRDGETDAMLDAAYNAWRADLAAGKSSVMIAENHETVKALNTRARLDLMVAGQVSLDRAIRLHDGTEAAKGDVVITRRNNRELTARRGWVKNGDRWVVVSINDDGAMTVRREGRRAGGSIVLPAGYVAKDVELAYATTTYRAQGVTVDTAHAIVHAASMTREALYVAMTRGRDSNVAYVATDNAALEGHQQRPQDDATAQSILFGVLHHTAAEPSAHEMIAAEQDTWTGIGQLAAEYETIAAAAQHDRWAALVEKCGFTREQSDAVITSEAFGPLTAELRRAEANHYDVNALLPRLTRARGFADAKDIAAVLRDRLIKATTRRTGSTRSRQAPRLIVGLIPEATGPMTDEMHEALNERRSLIEKRAKTLTDAAIRDQTSWATAAGPRPAEAKARMVWERNLRVVAAFRDRYQIAARDPLGRAGGDGTQRMDRSGASAALEYARALSRASAGNDRSYAARRKQPALRL
ncbi:hypothetical protein GCM10027052_09360 [Parafrigoribacterium mesophilum]|uniref:MobF family relaxase n=1 Tax=Parafrigoribacterium mesophilum TaxID=433646 RepID=UPI0031FC5CAC